MVNKISVAIISFNEERIIKKTILAVQDFAYEIVLVDSHSTDQTVEIAEPLGAKVYIEDWKGYSDQKNSAIEKCQGDWILSLDSDEIITSKLKEEILSLNNKDVAGYKIARKIFIGNKHIKYGGYYPDYQLRLFKNNIGAKFTKREVHESIQLEGEILCLKNPLEHYAYVNFNQYQAALDKYAVLASKEIDKKKASYPTVRAIWAFIYRYVFRLGFLEGVLGLNMVIAYARYVYKKYSLAKTSYADA